MARVDAEHKALAYVLRNPPAEWAVKPLSYVRIATDFVKKPDGSRPDTSTVRKVVKAFANAKSKRGRATGWRKTTPEEDAINL